MITFSPHIRIFRAIKSIGNANVILRFDWAVENPSRHIKRRWKFAHSLKLWKRGGAMSLACKASSCRTGKNRAKVCCASPGGIVPSSKASVEAPDPLVRKLSNPYHGGPNPLERDDLVERRRLPSMKVEEFPRTSEHHEKYPQESKRIDPMVGELDTFFTSKKCTE
jgi:hypothetical protein